LNITSEKTGPCQYTLTIEVEQERIETPLRQAAERINRYRPLPGFRPGKAPFAMIERQVGKGMLYREMLDKVGNDWYKEALEHNKLEPYAQGELDIVQLEPLTLKVVVPTEPIVTLGDYKSIKVTPKTVEVTQADIDESLTRLQEANALWQPVEHEVMLGNQVVIDATGTSDDGKPVEQKDVTLEVTEQLTPDGFAQNLTGIKPGETKEFDVDYPADFRDQSLAGKHVHFAVTVKAVKEKELPQLSDELAKGAGAEDLADYKAKVREQLQKQREQESHDQALDQALDALVTGATLEYPAVAVEQEVDDLLRSFTERLASQGFTMEGYLQLTKKTPAQLREERRGPAEERLKRGLVLVEFAKAEGIQVSKEETEQEITRVAESFGENAESVRQALTTDGSLRGVASDLFRRKALDRLLELAGGIFKKPETQIGETPGAAKA